MEKQNFKYISFHHGKYSISSKDFKPPVKQIQQRFYLNGCNFRSFVSLKRILKKLKISVKDLFVKEGEIWIIKTNDNFQKELEEYELNLKQYNEEYDFMIKYNREKGNKSIESVIEKKKETIVLIQKQIEELEKKLKDKD